MKNDVSIKQVRIKGFELSRISRYRDVLFGIAIIMIVIYHFSDDYLVAYLSGSIDPAENPIKSLLTFGYQGVFGSIGVEIFLILSGMGLYYSFSKNSDIRAFYKKRFSRLVVPYLMVALIFWAVKDLYILKSTILQYVSDITFVTMVTNGTRTIWFVGFILVMYLLFPLFYRVIFGGENRLIRFLILLVTVCAIPVMMYFAAPETFANTEIAITRTPVFVLGIFAGYYIRNDYRIPRSTAAALCITGIAAGAASVLIQAPDFVTRYLDGYYSCAVLIILTLLVYAFSNFHRMNSFLKWIGGYSLEIYMLHVTMRNLMKSFGFETYVFMQYFIMAVLAVLLSIPLKKISKKVISHIKRENDIFYPPQGV